MDEWSGFDDADPEIQDKEAALCSLADIIWCVSAPLVEKLKPRFPNKVRYVPNGVNYEFFSRSIALRNRSPSQGLPVLCYIGALDSWFDSSLVRGVAQQLPEWRIVLVGPPRLSATQLSELALPNITLAGSLDYGQLPLLLSAVDVCMIPFILNDLIRATSPIKLYEYLGAGLPVVSTPLPEVLVHQEAGVVQCESDPRRFAHAVRELQQTNARERRQAVARTRDWQVLFKAALREAGVLDGFGPHE
ncbi:MAG: glycosyltransferase [Phycisphaerae bacterium]|nr:glycosyltransferase [Phycisphaerae bacterium]